MGAGFYLLVGIAIVVLGIRAYQIRKKDTFDNRDN